MRRWRMPVISRAAGRISEDVGWAKSPCCARDGGLGAAWSRVLPADCCAPVQCGARSAGRARDGVLPLPVGERCYGGGDEVAYHRCCETMDGVSHEEERSEPMPRRLRAE